MPTISPPFFTKEEQDEFTISYQQHADKMQDVLEEYGVAIVTNVLDDDGCQSLENAFCRDFLNVVDIPNTFNKHPTLKQLQSRGLRSNDVDFKEFHNGGGLAYQRGLAMGKFAWTSRLHQHVRSVFEALYGTEFLSTGLDIPFFTPQTSPSQTNNHEWLHVDQNHNTSLIRKCYQGILYVWGSEDDRASSTVVCPKSHLPEVYNQIMDDPYAKGTSQQFLRLGCLQNDGAADLHWKAKNEARRLAMPPGSLLLWDSQLIHQGYQCGPRLAMPVCWEPTEYRPYDSRLRKLWMCAAGFPSTHSSVEGQVHDICIKEETRTGRPSRTEMQLRPTLVPWCVKGGMEEKWKDLEEKQLWKHGDNPSWNAETKKIKPYAEQIEEILRQD
eukprot:CAMPEP_0194199138 /NCGR_PEP_ID=MMETSP0156-20130528/267_1 /TAXON_ID=33649 /ORGANISM="Thalassionema nitzschioides, Strain L26-B" /LENGTH=383 /DNA_ID=CAMNT_0038923989 /DNA_START=14 /DNA_END=1162 /DNA_ORIENTATION=+